MTMNEAMLDGLSLMADVLGARRKVDDKLVKGYLFVIQEDGLKPEDVELACQWFTRDGEGTFPPGPTFRRQCIREKSRREFRQANAIYQSKLDAMDDPFSEESEDMVTKEEAHAHIAAVLAKLEVKWKNDNPLTRKPKTAKDIQRDIQAVRS